MSSTKLRVAPTQVFFMILWGMGVALTSGCRRDPPQPTVAYDREIAAQSAPAPNTRWLPDSYPWDSSRKSDINTLPDRIESTQNRFNDEIKILDRVVHGKK